MSGWEGMGADPEPPRRVGRTQNGQGVAVLDPANIASLQPWQDATYQQATRALDPQFQQMEARFNQDMVNRGIAQGSDAYTTARSDFDRNRNDAYGSARNQALAQALAAQNQGFNQSLGLDQVAVQASGIAAGRAGAEMGRAQNRYLADREFEEGRRRYDLDRGDNLGQQDFNNMGWLMGFDRDNQFFDAGQQQQDFNNQLPFFGLVPNQGPSQIDTYSPYAQQQQAAQANAANNSSRQNGMMGAIGTIGGAALTIF